MPDEASDTSVVKRIELPDNKALVRSADLYLDDGNIVLVAGNIAFRVHRSQLARHSEVFRDMLAIPSQPDGAEVSDGCPVVRLTDTPSDVLQLLLALYDNTRFHLDDLECLTSVLRLSSKYLIDHIRTFALEVLVETFPDTLDTFEEGILDSSDVIKVIKVAYAINEAILLPAAFYALSRFPTSEILDHDLPPHILATYCLGKGRLATKLAIFIDDLVDDKFSEDCDDRTCRKARQSLAANAQRMLREPLNILGSQPLGILEDLRISNDVCCECRPLLKVALYQERHEIWNSLPKTFGFGSWDTLREHR